MLNGNSIQGLSYKVLSGVSNFSVSLSGQNTQAMAMRIVRHSGETELLGGATSPACLPHTSPNTFPVGSFLKFTLANLESLLRKT